MKMDGVASVNGGLLYVGDAELEVGGWRSVKLLGSKGKYGGLRYELRAGATMTIRWPEGGSLRLT